VERVIILESNWDVGNIDPKSSRQLTATVYVPETIKSDTLRIPLTISYYNAQGNPESVNKIVDFYIKGLIDVSVYGIGVIQLSENQMVIGEIINEGNEDALFGFVTLEPLGNSNIKKQTQFIDEIETDAPVPFNIPIEFDGEPKYGEHEIKITVRYKDSLRDEVLLPYETTIFVQKPTNDNQNEDYSMMMIIPIVIAVGIGIFVFRRIKNKQVVNN